jgi:ABC-type oligopeptide transport system substrate-binding subunit
VHVKAFPWFAEARRLARRGEPFDLATGGWVADYPDPSAMLNPLLNNSSILPTLHDPTYQRRLAKTDRLTGPYRYVAYGEFAADLARNAAPLVAFGNAATHDFFSARIGCQVYGVYGLDLAALCVKNAVHPAPRPASSPPAGRHAR